jgi:hypothetical protein
MVVLKIDGSPRYLEAFDYGTLSKVLVSEGERVRSGQVIAILTPWPSPPGPHNNDTWVNGGSSIEQSG